MKVSLVKTFGFESAHRLPFVPEGHKCARLHGHSFQVEVVVTGDVDEKLGWYVDYGDITAAWRPLHDALDHRYLNEIPGLENPTSEVLARWIWTRLKPTLPGLSRLVVKETSLSRCEYSGE